MEGTPAAINTTDELSVAIDTMMESLRENDWGTVERIETPLGVHGVNYVNDMTEGPFATIGMVLPEHVYAEIEDGTYGQMQGFRIYKEDL